MAEEHWTEASLNPEILGQMQQKKPMSFSAAVMIGLETIGLLEGTGHGVKLRVTLSHQPEHISRIELRFVIRYDQASISDPVIASVFLTKNNTSNIQTAKITPNFLAAMPFLCDLDPKIDRLVEREQLWMLRFSYDSTATHACNFFTNCTYNGQQETINRLRQLFNMPTPNIVTLIVRGPMADISLSEMKDSFEAERENQPLRAWYPKHPNRIFLQLGDYAEPEKRPKYSLNAKYSFLDLDEYITVLGFGAIQENEKDSSSTEKIQVYELNLRTMLIPGAADRRYYAFLEFPDFFTNIRIMPGDKLAVNFNPEIDNSEEDWSATVVEHLPFAPLQDVSMLLTRRWIKDDRAWAKDNSDNPLHPINSKEMKNGEELREAITNARATKVKIRLQTSDKPLRQQIAALRKLQLDPTHKETLMRILLGNDYSDLPIVDAYETVGEDVDDILGELPFNQKQRESLNHMRALPGGIGIFQGPPGSGKTYFIIHCILPFLTNPMHSSDTCTKHQVFITAPVNDPLSDIAYKLNELVKERIPWREVIIIRLHSFTTEHLVAWQPAELERPVSLDARPSIFKEDEVPILDQMLVAASVVNYYKQATHQPFGIEDKRLLHIHLSLGCWMLKVAGYVSSPHAKPERFREFRQWFEQYRLGDEFSEDDMMNFRAETSELRDYVLSIADVIVCTLSLAGEQKLYSVTSPNIIFVDEAAKAAEPDLWPAFTHYNPRAYILVGDHKQLHPTVMSKAVENGFAPQLSISPFERFQANGLPSVMFEEQHRMHPEISQLVSKVFYGGKLRDAPNVLDEKVISTRIREYNTEIFSCTSTLMFINIHQGKRIQAGPNRSSMNFSNMAFVINLVTDLLRRRIAEPKDILILVPYESQYVGYLTSLTSLAEAEQDIDTRGITVRKIDGFQGGERPISILDLTVTDSLGFMREPNRLNVGVSRGMYAQYIVGHIRTLEGNEREKHAAVFCKRLVSECKVRAIVHTVQGKPSSPYVVEAVCYGRVTAEESVEMEDPWGAPDAGLENATRLDMMETAVDPSNRWNDDEILPDVRVPVKTKPAAHVAPAQTLPSHSQEPDSMIVDNMTVSPFYEATPGADPRHGGVSLPAGFFQSHDMQTPSHQPYTPTGFPQPPQIESEQHNTGLGPVARLPIREAHKGVSGVPETSGRQTSKKDKWSFEEEQNSNDKMCKW
jgi:hypothetical protein